MTTATDTSLVSGQLWRADDGTERTGPQLAERLIKRGFIFDVRQLVDTPIGGCIKTGVSAYERIK